jgi:hypothetical protein
VKKVDIGGLRDKIRKIIYTWQSMPEDDPNGPEVYPCERFVYYDNGVAFHARISARTCGTIGIANMLDRPVDLDDSEWEDYYDTVESIADEVWFGG